MGLRINTNVASLNAQNLDHLAHTRRTTQHESAQTKPGGTAQTSFQPDAEEVSAYETDQDHRRDHGPGTDLLSRFRAPRESGLRQTMRRSFLAHPDRRALPPGKGRRRVNSPHHPSATAAV